MSTRSAKNTYFQFNRTNSYTMSLCNDYPVPSPIFNDTPIYFS
jgi:hypothetical protein